jgi:hypothetical protein
MGAVVKLDRSNYLGDLAAGIREDHEAVEQGKASGLKHAIAAGKKLIEAKKKVKEERGSWIEWVENNCKFTRQLANMYMRVAKMENAVLHLSFRQAIQRTKKRNKKRNEYYRAVKLETTDSDDDVVSKILELIGPIRSKHVAEQLIERYNAIKIKGAI